MLKVLKVEILPNREDLSDRDSSVIERFNQSEDTLYLLTTQPTENTGDINTADYLAECANAEVIDVLETLKGKKTPMVLDSSYISTTVVID